jgi:translation initiation factor 6
MPAEIHLFDIYRSANIGIFLKANDKHCLVPKGLADTKSERISTLLKVQVLQASVAGSRLLGPLVAMNNKGIIVSRLSDDEEIRYLRESTGLNVQKLESRFTSVGNLIAANDTGAVISDVFGEESAKEVERTLEVPVRRMRIGIQIQVGAMISVTNLGALVHPAATEQEISVIGSVLGFEPEPATVNGGVPFVSSGFVGNSQSILIGARTRGAELMILGKAFG